MTDTYISVTPSDDRFDPAAAVDIVRGLQAVHDVNDSSGVLSSMINKVAGDTYPSFEFVVLTRGEDEQVEFLYGVDDPHLSTLEHRLQELYPESFHIEQRDIDIGKAIVPPVEMEVDDFATAVDEDALWDKFTVDDPEGDGRTLTDILEESGVGDEQSTGFTVGLSASAETVASAVDPEIGRPKQFDPSESPATLDNPTITHENTVLARPASKYVTPRGLRWHGIGNRKRDWMCQLQTFSEVTAADMERRFREEPNNRRLPLASLIDHLGDVDGPAAFQVVFEHKGGFERAADSRIDDLKRKSDTFFEELIGNYEKRSEEKLGERYAKRIEDIRENDPNHCFKTTIRLMTAPVEDCPYGTPAVTPPEEFGQFHGVFSDLNGEFYSVEPKRFTDEGIRQAKKRKNAAKAFQRFRERTVYTGSGKSRPDLVVNPDELASFITIPSSDELSTAAAREARSESTERTPLARPDPDELSYFREGMEIGYALDKNGEPDDEPLAVPAEQLTQHWARFAGTGSGKTVATQTDALTLHEETEGPTVVVNQKEDNFAQEYCQAHYARHGHLDDVYYLRVPDILPSMPLFDIRPALADGVDRQTAIQNVKDHFRELMRLVMGRKQFNQASVANEVMGHLIEALFDTKHGDDAYTLEDLLEAAKKMYKEEKIPPLSIENSNLGGLLERHTEKDDLQFARTMDGVINRLSQLHEQAHLREILNTVPEWDYTNGCYTRGLDFRDLVNEDVVVLLDLGDLGSDSQTAITYLLLRNLWHGVRPRRRRAQTADELPQVNVIIEEAAQIASTKLVYENFLPEGRGYGLALGLVMQFPEQVINADEDNQEGRRAYTEMLNNVHTKLIGHIEIQEDLAKTLTTGEVEDIEEIRRRLTRLPGGEWIVSLPQTEFGGTVPAAMSMQSMEIPPGHPEGTEPLGKEAREGFFEQFKHCTKRATARFDVESVDWYNRDGQYRRHTQPQAAASGKVHGPESVEIDGVPEDPSGRPQRQNPYANPGAEQAYGGGSAASTTSERAGGGGRERSQMYPGAPGEATGDDAASDERRSTAGGEGSGPASGGDSPDDGRADAGGGPDVEEVSPRESPFGKPPGRSDDAEQGPPSPPGGEAGAEPDPVSRGARDPQAVADEELEATSSDGVESDEGVENGAGAEPASGPTPGTADSDATPTDTSSAEAQADQADAADGGDGRTEFSTEGWRSESTASGGAVTDSDADSTTSAERGPPDRAHADTSSQQTVLRAEQKALLEELLLAMNREHPEYSLVEEGMKRLVDRYEVDVDALIDDGYLEKNYVVRRTYYTVTPKGREVIGKTLTVGDGKGDLGEKTPHIVGVELVKRMLESLRFDRIETYYRHNGTVYDVAAFEGNRLVWVGEVECESNNPDAIVEDYEKLAAVDAKAAWVFPTKSAAKSVMQALKNAGKIEQFSKRSLRNMDDFREDLDEMDAAGIDTAKTYDELIK